MTGVKGEYKHFSFLLSMIVYLLNSVHVLFSTLLHATTGKVTHLSISWVIDRPHKKRLKKPIVNDLEPYNTSFFLLVFSTVKFFLFINILIEKYLNRWMSVYSFIDDASEQLHFISSL
jgi:hypothetical protein